MTKTLIAASVFAALAGFAFAGPAHADALNGEAQHSTAYFHNGRNAPAASDAIAAAPGADTMQMPASGLGSDDYSSKSHGRP